MAEAGLIHLKDGTPATPSGKQNVKWQQGAPYGDTATVDGVTIAVTATDVSAYIPDVGSGTVIGFVINDGTAGTNVGPMLAAAHSGLITKCKVVTKASDGATALTFLIKKNGTNIFSANPTVAAGTASATVSTFTALTSTPIVVAADDVFSIDITGGGPAWKVSIQLE